MDTFLHILKVIGIILLVLLSFNIIIFVHELGHFLAARWRGLQVDRFQIWFGKPIWKKKINGVQWGLGIIPAGGFVALPQMAPMEAIEGENGERTEPLPPIKPIDKVIVAFAGPLFSFLLAVVAACIVWGLGMPDTSDNERTVGFIKENSHAESAGLQIGDEILKVNGDEVKGFSNGLEGIQQKIIFSEGDTITLTVLRGGEEIDLDCGFSVSEGSFLQRDGMRTIGFGMHQDLIFHGAEKGTPASISNFKENDQFLKADGVEIFSYAQLLSLMNEKSGKEMIITVLRGDKHVDVKTMPMAPSNGWRVHNDAELQATLGAQFKPNRSKLETINPTPGKQLKDAGLTMWTTLSKLLSPNSSINLGHMSGPVGIGETKFKILSGPHGLQFLFYFWVVFNINLAIFNLLPFPVLDGGHITMAVGEMIRKKPISTAVLEKVQVLFVLLLFSMLFFVTTKDIFSDRGGPDRSGLPAAPTYDLAPLQAALGLPLEEKEQ